ILPSKYPTDVQAEVLVKDEVSSEYIKEICFQNNDDLAQAKAAMNLFDTSKFVVDSSVFSNNRL
ncbi:MAG: DarT ssDNA thymidine ADP-ribosyltransferase family protein, partial [Salinivirgaceae bacterium]